jgi:type IX secretion system substrate protein
MKKNLVLLSALLFIARQNLNAQCTASITNIPHGDCANTDIELIASGGGTSSGYTYQWTGPQGFTSASQFVNIYSAQETASGMYKVVITNPTGCSSADSIQVIKHPAPIVYTGGQAGGCLNETTYISAQDFAGNYGPYTYFWDNGATTQQVAITHGGSVYPAPACFMTNVYGCTAANNTTFLIYTFPSPANPVIEALSATSFCKGGNVTLTTANDPNLTYQWQKLSSVISGATTSDYTTIWGGNYFVDVRNGLGCSARSNILAVTVFPKPDALISTSGSLNICNGDSVLLSTNPGANLSYQWKKYGSNIVGANAASLVVKKKGNYLVRVTNQHGCSKVSTLVTVTSNCREENEQANSAVALSVYPNPSPDHFNLELKTNDINENAQLILTDMTGRKISESNIQKNTTNFEFGKNLPAGIYNAMLINNDVVQTTRIVKTE